MLPALLDRRLLLAVLRRVGAVRRKGRRHRPEHRGPLRAAEARLRREQEEARLVRVRHARAPARPRACLQVVFNCPCLIRCTVMRLSFSTRTLVNSLAKKGG